MLSTLHDSFITHNALCMMHLIPFHCSSPSTTSSAVYTFRDSSRTPDLREHKWAAATDVDLGSDSNDE